jgi:glyoxylase-like metal-dependent hydrolase (beta-lactamase superfamily II)
MRRTIIAVMLLFAMWCSEGSFGAAPRFIKVSDHCYYLQLNESGENVAAIATDDGILMVNPPQEPDLSIAMEALATMTSKSVRWIVFTEPGFARTASARVLADRNALILAAARLQALSPPENAPQNGHDTAAPSPSRLIFDGQMHLFPSNVEVRIIALQHKARTGGDVAVFVPTEKVLFVGGLYEAARYPDIDKAAGGSPVDWIDGMKQVIDSVPVLKSAIPAAKPAAKPTAKTEPEKTLEEGITVISARGEVSNLQNMKDLLESCKKLRTDMARAVKAGRTLNSFLASSASDPYRSYGNFEPYAAQLFEALSK